MSTAERLADKLALVNSLRQAAHSLTLTKDEEDISGIVSMAAEALAAYCATQGVTPPERNEKLLALADRIDHDRLWARAGLERPGWTQEQHDRCNAGVELRRYADLLGQNCWRIFPPRPGFSFRASTLEAVVEMARKEEKRRIGEGAGGEDHV